MVAEREQDPQQRAQAAFDHAVQHEMQAIALHERAAVRHDDIALTHEQRAAEVQGQQREELLALAAQERARAEEARARANAVRQRLREDGVDLGDA